jgi:hypothetical protein
VSNLVSLALCLAAAIGMCTAMASPSLSAGPLETSGDDRWIVFASRQDVDEAIGLARRFGSDFGEPTALSTTDGWYAVASGPVAERFTTFDNERPDFSGQMALGGNVTLTDSAIPCAIEPLRSGVRSRIREGPPDLTHRQNRLPMPTSYSS